MEIKQEINPTITTLTMMFSVVRASSVQSRHQLHATGLDGPWLEYREDIPGGLCTQWAPGKGPRVRFPLHTWLPLVVRVGSHD